MQQSISSQYGAVGRCGEICNFTTEVPGKSTQYPCKCFKLVMIANACRGAVA
jgi:hypothetical protein